MLALLSDQVNKLRAKGTNACYIRSTMPDAEKEAVLHELTQKHNCYKLFYLTTEAATSERMKTHFKEMAKIGALGRFIVDEAHCIDTWGSTFRPAYPELSCLHLFGIPIHAFKGTATLRTQTIILERLQLTNPVVVRMPSELKNLFFCVTPKKTQKAEDDIVKIIDKKFKNECGIVFLQYTQRHEGHGLSFENQRNQCSSL